MKKFRLLFLTLMILTLVSSLAYGKTLNVEGLDYKVADKTAYYYGAIPVEYIDDYFDGSKSSMNWLPDSVWDGSKNWYGWKEEQEGTFIMDEFYLTSKSSNTFITGIENGKYIMIYHSSGFTGDKTSNNVDLTIEGKTYNLDAGKISNAEGRDFEANRVLKVPITVTNGKFQFDIKEKNNEGLALCYIAFLKVVEDPTNIEELVSTDGQIKIILNEKELVFTDAVPFLDNNGRLQVPLRIIADALAADTTWTPNTKQVKISRGETEIVLNIGDKNVLVNGKTKVLDTAAALKNDRTFVPARFVSEAFGADVKWNADSKVVTITYIKK